MAVVLFGFRTGFFPDSSEDSFLQPTVVLSGGRLSTEGCPWLLPSSSQTLACIQITQRLCEAWKLSPHPTPTGRASESVSLGWGLRPGIANSNQVMLALPFRRPHFEKLRSVQIACWVT